jgi:hypothetical protein
VHSETYNQSLDACVLRWRLVVMLVGREQRGLQISTICPYIVCVHMRSPSPPHPAPNCCCPGDADTQPESHKRTGGTACLSTKVAVSRLCCACCPVTGSSVHVPTLMYPSHVVQWSEVLTTDPEVPGSIPDATTFSE